MIFYLFSQLLPLTLHIKCIIKSIQTQLSTITLLYKNQFIFLLLLHCSSVGSLLSVLFPSKAIYSSVCFSYRVVLVIATISRYYYQSLLLIATKTAMYVRTVIFVLHKVAPRSVYSKCFCE